MMQLPDDHEVKISEYDKVYDWLVKSCELQYKLGNDNLMGIGMPQNFNQAFDWYMVSASNGHHPSQCDLGFLYHNGLGVKRDFEEAFKWFMKSANQGNATAQYNLASMYFNGEGTSRNKQQALLWCTKAAKQMDVDAKRMLWFLRREIVKAKFFEYRYSLCSFMIALIEVLLMKSYLYLKYSWISMLYLGFFWFGCWFLIKLVSVFLWHKK